MDIKQSIKKFFKKAERELDVVKGEKAKNRIYSSRKIFKSERLAKVYFAVSRKRLWNVNSWSKIPRLMNANFQLYTPQGEICNSRKVFKDAFIKIVLPGPFPENWVKVVDVKEGEDFAQFTVSPSEDPTLPKDKEVVKHFFSKEATSTFLVKRKSEMIYAYEIGRNEYINVDQPEAGARPAANVVIAEGGWSGLQKIQWKILTEYLVGKEHISDSLLLTALAKNKRTVVLSASAVALGVGIAAVVEKRRRRKMRKKEFLPENLMTC